MIPTMAEQLSAAQACFARLPRRTCAMEELRAEREQSIFETIAQSRLPVPMSVFTKRWGVGRETLRPILRSLIDSGRVEFIKCGSFPGYRLTE